MPSLWLPLLAKGSCLRSRLRGCSFLPRKIRKGFVPSFLFYTQLASRLRRDQLHRPRQAADLRVGQVPGALAVRRPFGRLVKINAHLPGREEIELLRVVFALLEVLERLDRGRLADEQHLEPPVVKRHARVL